MSIPIHDQVLCLLISWCRFVRAEDAKRARDLVDNTRVEGGSLTVHLAFIPGYPVQREQRPVSSSGLQQHPQVPQPIYLRESRPVLTTPTGEHFFRSGAAAETSPPSQEGLPSSREPPTKAGRKVSGARAPEKGRQNGKRQASQGEQEPKTPSPTKRAKQKKAKSKAASTQSPTPLSRKESAIASAQSSEPISRKQSAAALASVPEDTKTEKAPEPVSTPTAEAQSPATKTAHEAKSFQTTGMPIPVEIIEKPALDTISKDHYGGATTAAPQPEHALPSRTSEIVGQEPMSGPLLDVGAISTGSPTKKPRRSPPSRLVAPSLADAKAAEDSPRKDTTALNDKPAVPVVKLPTPHQTEFASEKRSPAPESKMVEARENKDVDTSTVSAKSNCLQQARRESTSSDVAHSVKGGGPETESEKQDLQGVHNQLDSEFGRPLQSLVLSTTTPEIAATGSASGIEAETSPVKDILGKVQTKSLTESGKNNSTCNNTSEYVSLDKMPATPVILPSDAEVAVHKTPESKEPEHTEVSPAENVDGSGTALSIAKSDYDLAEESGKPAEELVTKSPTEQCTALDENEYPTLAASAQLAKTSKRSPPRQRANLGTAQVSYSAVTKQQPPEAARQSTDQKPVTDLRKIAKPIVPVVPLIKLAKAQKPTHKGSKSVSGPSSSKRSEPDVATSSKSAKSSAPKADESARWSKVGDPTKPQQPNSGNEPEEIEQVSAPGTVGPTVEHKSEPATSTTLQTQESETDTTSSMQVKRGKLELKILTPGSFSQLESSTDVELLPKTESGETTATIPSDASRKSSYGEISMEPVSTHKKSMKKKKRLPAPNVKDVVASAIKRKQSPPEPVAEKKLEPTKSPSKGYSFKAGDIQPENLEPEYLQTAPVRTRSTIDLQSIAASLMPGESRNVSDIAKDQGCDVRTVLSDLKEAPESNDGALARLEDKSPVGDTCSASSVASAEPEKGHSSVAKKKKPSKKKKGKKSKGKNLSKADSDSERTISLPGSPPKVEGTAKESSTSGSDIPNRFQTPKSHSRQKTSSAKRQTILLNPEAALVNDESQTKRKSSGLEEVMTIIRAVDPSEQQSDPKTPTKPKSNVVAFVPTPKRESSRRSNSSTVSSDSSGERVSTLLFAYTDEKSDYSKQRDSIIRAELSARKRGNLRRLRKKRGSDPVPPYSLNKSPSRQATEELKKPDELGDFTLFPGGSDIDDSDDLRQGKSRSRRSEKRQGKHMD